MIVVGQTLSIHNRHVLYTIFSYPEKHLFFGIAIFTDWLKALLVRVLLLLRCWVRTCF
jgi:hypothetical protein